MTRNDGVEDDDEYGTGGNPYVFNESTTNVNIIGRVVKIGKDLTEEQKETMRVILDRFRHIFSFIGELGNCNITTHDIDTGDAIPVHFYSL